MTTTFPFSGYDVDISDVRFRIDNGVMQVERNTEGMYRGATANAVLVIDALHPLKPVDRQTIPAGTLRTSSVYVAAPEPKTTAQTLALAVLMGEPCGRQLVDCLIEEGVVDVEGEFAAKVKAETLAAVDAVLDKVMQDQRTATRYPDHIVPYCRVSHVRQLISELA
jgi:hypothetical protein